MSDQYPIMIIVGGCNGAGKTTSTGLLSKFYPNSIKIIDADKIKFDNNFSSLEAGKVAVSTINDCIAKGESFILETTLSSKFNFKMIEQAKSKGFKVLLNYIGLIYYELAIERVAERVAKGGHFIPEDDIKRRYARSLTYLPEAINSVDGAKIIDNSSNSINYVAKFENKLPVFINKPPAWLAPALDALGLSKI